jgi:cytochrome c oxidase accessory protein FixG
MSHPNNVKEVEEDLHLYAKRKAVYPKAVDGWFRRLKWLIMVVTLTIYYVTPWLRWDRGAYAPDQAVLVDLAHRRFFMFSIEIWPHEFYYVAGLLIMAGIGLFLLTSAVGRAWCGYACPQTVWTDLFVHVERFIDGDRNAQIRLANAPLSLSKITRRLIKHGLWLMIAVMTGGAWIFYFADAPSLLHDFVDGRAPFIAYATVGVLTATTYTFGGLMREQVCIYMCPWPRIQTAMMDEKSLAVTYKDWRGEPRSRGMKKALEEGVPTGDCIDCNQCVQVCPTGIEIREGPQIGCITCALCIDACDKVMHQLGKPRGLIDYITLLDAEEEAMGHPRMPVRKRIFRPRTIIYFSIWGAIGLAMMFSLGNRTRIDISALKDRNPLFVKLSDGTVRNAFTIKVRNMEARPRQVEIGLLGMDDARMWAEPGDRDTAQRTIRLVVAPDSVSKDRIYVISKAPEPAREEFSFTVRALDKQGGSDSDKVTFDRAEGQ